MVSFFLVADFLSLEHHVTHTLARETFGISIFMIDSNLSNFSANIIHDMQVLELVLIEAQ